MNKTVINERNFSEFLNSKYYSELCFGYDSVSEGWEEYEDNFENFINYIFEVFDYEESHDSSYFYEDLEIDTETYVLSFRRSRYIKDEVICYPQCDEFDIFLKEDILKKKQKEEQLNLDKWNYFIQNNSKEELFNKLSHLNFDSLELE